MGYMGSDVGIRYKFGGILPDTDSTLIRYKNFTSEFSEDGSILVIGVQDDKLYELEHFNAWKVLGDSLKAIRVPMAVKGKDGKKEMQLVQAVDSVFSLANLYTINRNDSLKKFDFVKLTGRKFNSQQELDSALTVIRSLPFYQDLLYNKESGASLMMVFTYAPLFNSKYRDQAIVEIERLLTKFDEQHMKPYVSGLPFIRSVVAGKIKKELGLFVGLAVLVTSLLLFLFFRSLRVVGFSMLVVITGVIWSMGVIGICNYQLSVLMGLIPPLMIVIGIPNCIFLLNKYHQEYKNHGNKIKALSRVIQKIGNATFMTNCTTAMGFATFIFTDSPLLTEFGVVASINILVVFFLSILLIPIIFSFLEEPQTRHTKHLSRKWLDKIGDWLVWMVEKKRPLIYVTSICMVVIGFVGISKIQVTGNIVDDLPQNHPILKNLNFFETHFHGVMPLEIVVDTKKSGGATKRKNLKKIEKVQKLLREYPEISKSLSVVDALKFSKQAFYNGLESKYTLINSSEQRYIAPYLKNTGSIEGGGNGMLKAFIDSTSQKVRISAQMADIGTLKMDELLADIRPKVDSILNPNDFNVEYTGTSVVFVKGTQYLVKNLFVSLGIAIIVIASLMALLFSSWRMVIISFVPNLIPLIFTAAIMGYMGISIKPSTILVFSIAFGISVDDTIHYLAKYRQELRVNYWNIGLSVKNAVRETGTSMIYTSIILFFGFGVFTASEFGGTQALGVLVSMTLLAAMSTNLLLLPSLLMSLERYITTLAFKEPLMEIIDEEEDIDLSELQVLELGEAAPKEPEEK